MYGCYYNCNYHIVQKQSHPRPFEMVRHLRLETLMTALFPAPNYSSHESATPAYNAAVGMRRLYAILLVCVIGWPMLWPVLAQGSSVVPHACCLRKHHCDSDQTQLESPHNHDCCRSVRTVARASFLVAPHLHASFVVQPIAASRQYASPEITAQALLPVRAPPVA